MQDRDIPPEAEGEIDGGGDDVAQREEEAVAGDGHGSSSVAPVRGALGVGPLTLAALRAEFRHLPWPR